MAAAVAVLPEAPENREAQADPVAQELSESVAAMAVAVELVAAVVVAAVAVVVLADLPTAC